MGPIPIKLSEEMVSGADNHRISQRNKRMLLPSRMSGMYGPELPDATASYWAVPNRRGGTGEFQSAPWLHSSLQHAEAKGTASHEQARAFRVRDPFDSKLE